MKFEPTCSIDGCNTKTYARGWCSKHYLRWLKQGTTDFVRSKKEKVKCSFDGCTESSNALGLCKKHYARFVRHGDPSIVKPTGVAAGVKLPRHNECVIEGCFGLGPYIKGLCRAHYARRKAHGDPLAGRPKDGVITTRKSFEKCNADGCDRIAVAKGYCNPHWTRVRKYGDSKSNEPLRKYGAGGEYVHNGYVSRWDKVSKSVVFVHRLVMSEMIGRPLFKNENVHHKNGKRGDNRPKNLELWVTSQPSGQRPIDLLEWARSIIATYAVDEEKFRNQI